MLLEKGSSIDLQNMFDNSALVQATLTGHGKVVGKMLDSEGREELGHGILVLVRSAARCHRRG